jgi:hypothetical protein
VLHDLRDSDAQIAQLLARIESDQVCEKWRRKSETFLN